MKYIFIALSLVLFSFSMNSQTSSGATGGYDSLLFDGAINIIDAPLNIASECYIRVIYAHGSATGTYYVTKTYETCGEWDTVQTTETGKLSPFNELKIGEEITTGDNSSLEMQFYDGSILKMGPNSKIKITGNMCESRSIIHKAGKIWSGVKKLLGSAKYEVRTDRFAICVRGTEFSVEITDSGDITKVYEGSVSVSPPVMMLTSEEEAKAMQQITMDYQSGKISMDEFVKKTQEYSSRLEDRSEDMKSKICEAGNMITAKDKISAPVSMESTGSEWFEDVNFRK
jgi:hypothetical protein